MVDSENIPKVRVLNLYAGIGGNRKLWENVDVTAVEKNKSIADIYSHFFPCDDIIIDDAHSFLLDHFQEFDFIWSSPPCITHSLLKLWGSKQGKHNFDYPNLNQLYGEIIFLKHYCDVPWVVENVIGYYEPLIKPLKIGRHYFWSNFFISPFIVTNLRRHLDIVNTSTVYGFNISKFKTTVRKDQILRNIFDPELGLHIFNCAFKTVQQSII